MNKRNTIVKIKRLVSLVGGKATSTVNGAINNEVDNFDNPLTMNVQLSVSKDHTSCEFHVNSTPVAHHTKSTKLSFLSPACAISETQLKIVSKIMTPSCCVSKTQV